MAQEPGSNLPAPYVNPWSLLLRDLKAVLASLGLSLREVLRRYREGTLPTPAFWPEALRFLLWPLLLVLAIALPVAGALAFGHHRPHPIPVDGSEPAAVLLPAPSGSLPQAPEQPPASVNDAVAAAGSLAPASPGSVPGSSISGPVTPMQAPSPPPRAELLRAQLMRPEAEGVLLAVEEDADRLGLVLSLDPSFATLPESRQESLAALWQELGLNLGYEQLELLDPAGDLLGRSASVGSGMILFTMAAGG